MTVKTKIANRPLKIASLNVEDQLRLRVFIWQDYEDMYYANRNTNFRGTKKATEKDEYGAYFYSGEVKSSVSRQEVYTRVVGNIHLVHDHYGAGVFAHELQHFIQYYIDLLELDPIGKDWERVPKLVQDLTSEYWEWFYDNFELEK